MDMLLQPIKIMQNRCLYLILIYTLKAEKTPNFSATKWHHCSVHFSRTIDRQYGFHTKELSHVNYFSEKNYNIELALSRPLNVSSYIHFKAGRKGISIINITICSRIFIDLASYFTVARMKNNCTFKGLAKTIHSITCKVCISFIPTKICRDALLKRPTGILRQLISLSEHKAL